MIPNKIKINIQDNRISVWEFLFYSFRICIFLNYFPWSEQEQLWTYKNIKRIMKCLNATYTTGEYFTVTKSSVRKTHKVSHTKPPSCLTWHPPTQDSPTFPRPSTHRAALHHLSSSFTALHRAASPEQRPHLLWLLLALCSATYCSLISTQYVMNHLRFSAFVSFPLYTHLEGFIKLWKETRSQAHDRHWKIGNTHLQWHDTDTLENLR